MNFSNGCAVYGCVNDRRDGKFIGDVCAPCHTMLTTGKVGCGNTFIHTLRDDMEALRTAGIDIPLGPPKSGYHRVTATDVMKMLDQLAAIRVALNR